MLEIHQPVPPVLPGFVTLRDYVDVLMSERDKLVSARLSSTQRALDLAEISLKEKLSVIDSLNIRVGTLENSKSNMDGRMWSIGAVIVLVNLVIAVFVLFYRK